MPPLKGYKQNKEHVSKRILAMRGKKRGPRKVSQSNSTVFAPSIDGPGVVP